MNKNGAGDESESPNGRGNLRGFYSYKNTFDKDSVWLDIPKHGMSLFSDEGPLLTAQ